jgi:putative MATE family efflux protein
MSAPVQPKLGLLGLAGPIFVEQGLRMLIVIVDALMVSRAVSVDAAAALSGANQWIYTGWTVFNFVAIGASVVITHHLGAGDRAGAARITATAIAACTWLGAATSLALWLLAGRLLEFNLHESLIAHGEAYLRLVGGMLFLDAMSMAIAATLRAHRHTRDTMLVLGGQSLLNLAGNAVLLYGLFGAPQMGVEGVALSGVISRACACVALWILLDRRTHLRLGVRDFFVLSWDRLRRVLRIGLPAAGENMCYLGALLVVTSFIKELGSAEQAAQTVAQNLQRLVIIFSLSLGLGTEIVIGHLVGAGQLEEAYRTLLKNLRLGVLLALGAVLVVAALAPAIAGQFTHDPAILSQSVHLMLLGILIEPGRVYNIVVINSLRATGDVWFPIAMGAVSMWCVWVPLAWLLGLHTPLGLYGIWLTMALDEWLRGLMMRRRWQQRHWMKTATKARDHVAQDAEAEAGQLAGM